MKPGVCNKQRGAVLVVGLVMLVMLTLMAIAAFKFGKSHFAVVANQQTRLEAGKAAEQVIEQIIDNPNIDLAAGSNLFGAVLPGATATNEVPVDVNGDATADYTVRIAAPVCVKRRAIANDSLFVDRPDDLGCKRSVDQAAMGIEGSSAGESLCSEVVWDVRSTATDRFSGDVSVTIVQGLGQRVATTRLSEVCD